MRGFLLLSAGVFYASAAGAQTTSTAIALNFPGLTLAADTLSGNGAITPFGSSSISLTLSGQTGSAFVFTFADGDTMRASVTSFSGGVDGGSGAASISGGTGLFAGASGTFNFAFAPAVNQQTGAASFLLTGTGTAVLQSSATGGPGGAGYPVSGPGGPGYPSLSAGGAQIVLCQNPASHSSNAEPLTQVRAHSDALVIAPADCTTAASDSGINYYPIYDTSDPNASTQLAFWVSAQQLQAAASLEYQERQEVLEMIRNIGNQFHCLRCDATSATVSAGTASINIVTPVQTTAATYSAVPSCPASPNSCWISIPTPTGTIAASSRAAITAVVDPSALAPGVYSGNVAVTIASGSATPSVVNAPVAVVVNPSGQILSVSQTGLQFQAATGSTVMQAQPVSVQTAGSGAMSFSASASVLTGGNWLTVSPASGSATSSTASTVSVQANPSGLAAGQYFGIVTITASGAVNSPQLIDVALSVGATSNGSPLITPAGLSFIAPATGNPNSQTVQFINLTTGTLAVTATPQFGTGTGWFTAASSSSSVAPGQTLGETIAVNAVGLSAGTYVGNLDLHVTPLNADYFVPVVLVVPRTAPTPEDGTIRRAAVSGCTPSRLLPIFTNLTGGFQTSAGLPVSVQVAVTDDCGSPLTSGNVTMYFPGSGDAARSMAPLGNGQWAASWLPHNAGGGTAEIGVIASESSPALIGSAGVSGTVSANSATPIISPGGVVSAASLAAGGPLPIAPGEFISIFGGNFIHGGQVTSIPAPYQTQLSQVQVLLAGELLPLQVTAPGQINAVVPYDAAAASSQQIMVELSGSTYSMSEPVIVAAAQPSIFTQDQSGSGPGAILTAKSDGTVTLNTASAPASAGDVLEIYCTGLGTASPAVPVGTAAPSTLSYTTNTVTATIGGKAAQVGFAGLAPGYAGLYQVNVTVPSGLTPGSSVSLVLSAAGASSPPVTVAIK